MNMFTLKVFGSGGDDGWAARWLTSVPQVPEAIHPPYASKIMENSRA